MLALPSSAAAAMSIDSGPRVAVNPYQVTIWWHSSSTGSSELRWDTQPHATFTDYPNDVSNAATTLGTLHSRTISNLMAGTYYLQARTTGALGTATSASRTFVVSAADAATPVGSTVVGGGEVLAIATTASKVYLGGAFTQVGSRTGSGINVDPTTAAAVGGAGAPQFFGDVAATIPDGGGGRFVGGDFATVGGLSRPGVAHLLPDGGLDPYFIPGAGLDGPVHALAISGGRLYIGGEFDWYNGTSRSGIAAVDLATATVDATFNPGTGTNAGGVLALTLSGTKLYLGGWFTSYGAASRNRIAAVDSTTAVLDATFNPGTGFNGSVLALATSGTKLYLGGNFTTYAGTARNSLAAVDTSTAALDVTFAPGTGANQPVRALDAGTGSSVFMGGHFSGYQGTSRSHLAALDATTGALDTTFVPAVTDFGIDALAVSGTKLYVGGQFSTYGGTSRNDIAAVDTTTAVLDATFNPGTGPNSFVMTIALRGTRLYLGGTFTTVNGSARTRVAAIDATTAAVDATFNPGAGPNSQVDSLVTDATRLYVGGHFTTYAGVARAHVVAVGLTTGMLDNTFDPGTGINGSVYSLLLDGTRLFLGGSFSTIGAVTHQKFGALTAATGVLDATYDVGSGADDTVWTMASSATNIYLGGYFTVFNGIPQSSFAAIGHATPQRLADAGPLSITVQPQINLAPYQATIWWKTSATSSSDLVWDTVSRSSWFEYQNSVSNTDTALGAAHSRTIGNLPQGTYFYRVRSRNAAGEQVTSAQRSFLVGSPDAATPLGSTVIGGSVDASEFNAAGTTLYIAGGVMRVTRRAGNGIALDRTTPTVAAGSPQIAGTVLTSIPDGAGGWYAGGSFTKAGGLTRYGVAHLLPDGGVDPTFDTPGVTGTSVNALVLNGGTLYVGGTFTTMGGAARSRIAAVSATTGAATAWAPASTGSVVYRMVLNGTTLYVGGTFTSMGGQLRNYIAALDTTTGLATAWNPNANSRVRALALVGATLYIGGDFTTVNGGTARAYIAAIDTGTGIATAWAPNSTGSVYAIAVNGTNVYAGGSFTTIGGAARGRIAAIDTGTALATAWNPTSNGTVYDLGVDATSIFAVGVFTNIGGQPRDRVAELSPASGLATAWNPGATAAVNGIGVTPSRVFIGGDLTGIGGTVRNGAAALDGGNGELLDWNPNVAGYVDDMLVTPTSVYLAGSFTTVGVLARADLAEVDPVTGIATAWNPGTSGNANSIVLSGGTLYVGGFFATLGGSARANIGAVSTATGLATAFNPGANNEVRDVVLSGANVYIGGFFTTAGAQPRSYLAAFSTAGVIQAWNPGTDAAVETIAASGSQIYVSCYWCSTIGGQPRFILGAVDATTGLATSWDPGVDDDVYQLTVIGSSVYTMGPFSTLGGVSHTGIGRIDATTGVVDAWDPAINSVAFTMATSGNRIFVGGAFSNANEIAQAGGALFNTCDRSTFCSDEELRDYVTVSAPAGVAMSSALPDSSATAQLAVTVQSNAMFGYSLLATDTSDTDALSCTVGNCAGFALADWSGVPGAPTAWPDTGANYGFGVSVLSSTLAPKLAAWGPGATATDFTNNRYVGLDAATSTTIHSTTRYLATSADTTTIALRGRASPTQRSGAYAGTITLTAIANP